MRLKFTFAEDYSITDAYFDGLDGYEPITSLKEALNMMKIENPAVSFSDDFRNGVYGDVSGEERRQMRNTVKCISSLWQYKDVPEGISAQYEMSVLMLLINAVELISRLNARPG